MITKEVEFNPDEAQLLALIRQRVKKDGAIAISDTELIRVLNLTAAPQRFFAAKMRLMTAGVIQAHVDGMARQVIQLTMPERPNPASSRYVFTVVPLECLPVLRKLVGDHRRRKAASHVPAAGATPAPAVTPNRAKWSNGKDQATVQKEGMQRLGVRPLPPKFPIPPVKTLAKPE